MTIKHPQLQEKPKEKTIFTVKLEAFDASAKPKIIKEVKAMNPTFTLVAVRLFIYFFILYPG